MPQPDGCGCQASAQVQEWRWLLGTRWQRDHIRQATLRSWRHAGVVGAIRGTRNKSSEGSHEDAKTTTDLASQGIGYENAGAVGVRFGAGLKQRNHGGIVTLGRSILASAWQTQHQ